MKVAVWDTYVDRTDGKVMHFDILVPDDLKDEEKIFTFGREFLKSKAFGTGNLTSSECQFCHIGQATDELKEKIAADGFYIIEMQNCE